MRLQIPFLIAISLLLTCTGCAIAPPGPISSDIALRVPPATTHQAGDNFVTQLVLKNTGLNTIRLPGIQSGSYEVISFTRNGAAVPTREIEMWFDQPLDISVMHSLQEVAPGAQISVDWETVHDRELGGIALINLPYARHSPATGTAYLVSLPGQYQITLYFRRVGGPASRYLGAAGPSNLAIVRFTIL